ncbi:GDSL-type esterase/lipase family protein [Chondromyces crocatus]|uniref:GDSL-type esterase/lipase family protein n=1 Tax=Chondromyces crocatus TaxID=52 RepID=UPI001FDFC521|nr:GDSL-type esterase/lipase family protein [Chondromyces crocatus]
MLVCALVLGCGGAGWGASLGCGAVNAGAPPHTPDEVTGNEAAPPPIAEAPGRPGAATLPVALVSLTASPQGGTTPRTETGDPREPSGASKGAVPAPGDDGFYEAIDGASAPRPGDAPYGRLYAALRDLEKGRRRDHVRLMWLGDSHGAADFWSGALRSALQKRFGYAGPGFVHLGYTAYRHDGVKHGVGGKWKLRPKGPATSVVTGDGVFGLGGILFVPDGASMAQISLTEPKLTGRLRWDVCYRLNGPNDQVTVALTGSEPVVVKATPDLPPGAVRHLELFGDASATLTVTPTGGAPELCGAVIEADAATRPGVVLDTLGINGARFGTPLAWNEASWAAEFARRSPTLVVLEYGTNEAGDFAADPSRYGRQMTELLTRIRRVTSEVDCLALAPTDRHDTQDRTHLVRDAIRDAAKANGCGFWDTYEIMGGKGSISAWGRETPARAAKDGVHLTRRGYLDLGARLADDVLRGYRP